VLVSLSASTTEIKGSPNTAKSAARWPDRLALPIGPGWWEAAAWGSAPRSFGAALPRFSRTVWSGLCGNVGRSPT